MCKMKKILLSVLLPVLLLTLCFALNSCDGSNEAVECPHSYNEWETLIPATCQNEGLQKRTCKLDPSHVEERTLDKLPHSFENYVSNLDATCSKNGTKTAYCSTLGCMETNTIEDVNSKLPHSFTEMIVSEEFIEAEATCKKKARYYYSCLCGAVGTTVPSFEYGELAHDFGSEWTYDEVNHWHECSECKLAKDGAAHEWDEGVLVTAAGCTVDGETVYTCACGATKSVAIPASHKLKKTDAKAASCVAVGNVEYWSCDVCKLLFSDAEGKNAVSLEDTVLAITAHDFENGTYVYDDEAHFKKCADCDAKTESEKHHISFRYDSVSCWDGCDCGYVASGDEHWFVTSNDAENHWKACINCPYVTPDEPHGKIWHDEDGKHYYECDGCDFVSAKEEHSWDEGVVTTPALCYVDGVKTYTCSVCKLTKEEAIPASHKLILVEAKSSTCTQIGNIEHYNCEACDAYFSDAEGLNPLHYNEVFIDMLPHNFAEGTLLFDENGHFVKCKDCDATTEP